MAKELSVGQGWGGWVGTGLERIYDCLYFCTLLYCIVLLVFTWFSSRCVTFSLAADLLDDAALYSWCTLYCLERYDGDKLVSKAYLDLNLD
jgi:hypothetical protein